MNAVYELYTTPNPRRSVSVTSKCFQTWFFEATFGFWKNQYGSQHTARARIMSLHLASCSETEVTLGTGTGFVPERPQSRGGCAARKASPGGGISRSVTEVWEFNTRTLSHHKLHVPKGLWLRLEMGTGGGQMKSQKFWAARPHRCSKRAGRSKLQFPTVLTLFQGERVDTFR